MGAKFSKNQNLVYSYTLGSRQSVSLTVDNMFIIYINLEHRTDRRQEMQQQLQNVGWNHEVHRESATKHPVHAYFGVPDSHISCLKKGMASGKPYICVFEDDFDFFVSGSELAAAMAALSAVDFDVFLLDSGHGVDAVGKTIQTNTNHPYFKRVIRSISTAGYLLHSSYAPRLIQNFETGKQLLTLYPKHHVQFCIDRYWSQLQKKDVWLCYHQKIGGQRVSYSDIEKQNTDYNQIK